MAGRAVVKRSRARRWRYSGLLVLVGLALSACVAPPGGTPGTGAPGGRETVAAASTTLSLTVDGAQRTATVRSPAHRPGELLPVIVGLHGAGGNARTFEEATGLAKNVSLLRYIAVFPNGTSFGGEHRAWNAGTCCAINTVGGVNDVAFVGAVLDRLIASHDADATRVYLAGFSNGGMLSYRAACELGGRIAGIAVVGGALNVADCPSRDPVPLLLIHGTADQVVPFGGGVPRVELAVGMSPWVNGSVADAIATWTDRNHCSSRVDATAQGLISRRLFADCAGDSYVDVYEIAGGGHSWPVGHGSLDVTDVVQERFIGSR